MAKQQYKIHNWKDYNQALVNRGSVIFWLDEEVIQQWHVTERTGKPGRPKKYSDIAIQSALVLREIFHLPLRATEGLLCSLINWAQLGIHS